VALLRRKLVVEDNDVYDNGDDDDNDDHNDNTQIHAKTVNRQDHDGSKNR
jgi:hypothetical protein